MEASSIILMAIRNLAFLRNVPKFRQRLVETFDDVQSMLNNVGKADQFKPLEAATNAAEYARLLSPLWLAAA